MYKDVFKVWRRKTLMSFSPPLFQSGINVGSLGILAQVLCQSVQGLTLTQSTGGLRIHVIITQDDVTCDIHDKDMIYILGLISFETLDPL